MCRFDDLAPIHYEHFLTYVFHYRKIVGDEKVRNTHLLLQVLKQIDNLSLHAHVKSAHRFVANDQHRFDGQGARNPDPLTLSSAEFMRKPMTQFGLKAHFSEQIRRPVFPLRPVEHRKMHSERFADDLKNVPSRIKRTKRILKDHLDLTTQRSESRIRQITNLLSTEKDFSTCDLHEFQNGQSNRSLPTSAFSDETHGLRGSNRE